MPLTPPGAQVEGGTLPNTAPQTPSPETAAAVTRWNNKVRPQLLDLIKEVEAHPEFLTWMHAALKGSMQLVPILTPPTTPPPS